MKVLANLINISELHVLNNMLPYNIESIVPSGERQMDKESEDKFALLSEL